MSALPPKSGHASALGLMSAKCHKRTSSWHLDPALPIFTDIHGSATLIAPRYHGTIQCLLESGYEILLSINSNVEAATLLGEALRIQYALFTGPRIGLVAETNDVNGKPQG